MTHTLLVYGVVSCRLHLYTCVQGNPVEKKVLPERVSFYTDSHLPHTQSQTIGASLASSHSRSMIELERLTSHRKRRTDIGDNYKYS